MITRFIYALVLVAMVGLSQPSSAATSVSATKQTNTPNQQKTPADAQIERTMKNKLAKSKMNADHFTISVVKGEATIEGSTNIMQRKGAMTRMAKSSGATSVRNNIRVSDAARAKATSSLANGRSGALNHQSAASGATGGTPVAAQTPISRATVLPPTVSKQAGSQ